MLQIRRRVKQVPLAFYKSTPSSLFSELDFPGWTFKFKDAESIPMNDNDQAIDIAEDHSDKSTKRMRTNWLYGYVQLHMAKRNFDLPFFYYCYCSYHSSHDTGIHSRRFYHFAIFVLQFLCRRKYPCARIAYIQPDNEISFLFNKNQLCNNFVMFH